MKKKEINKINVKSESGFTMTDLATAIVVFIIFTGMLGTLFYSCFKLNAKVKISAVATDYAVRILEDIDKISYEEVLNGMQSKYITEYSIPDGYNVVIEVSKYNQGNEKEDLIKNVKLTISYKIAGDTENIVVKRLKVKEV